MLNRKELPRTEKHENLTKCIANALSSHFQLSLQFDTLVIFESVSARTISNAYEHLMLMSKIIKNRNPEIL